MVASAEFDGQKLWESYSSDINENNLFFKFMSEIVKWALVQETGLNQNDY